jgi:hypothetical protein
VAWHYANGSEANRGPWTKDLRRKPPRNCQEPVKLWDPATGREILTLLHGKGDQVTGIGFSHDGWQIFSTGKSGSVRIWDATPLQERAGQ